MTLVELEPSRDLTLENAIRVILLGDCFEQSEVFSAVALQDFLGWIGIVQKEVRIVNAALFRELLNELSGLLDQIPDILIVFGEIPAPGHIHPYRI